MGYYRPLHWWTCGLCSLLNWEYVFWQQDIYGNAVVVNIETLRAFHGYEYYGEQND